MRAFLGKKYLMPRVRHKVPVADSILTIAPASGPSSPLTATASGKDQLTLLSLPLNGFFVSYDKIQRPHHGTQRLPRQKNGGVRGYSWGLNWVSILSKSYKSKRRARAWSLITWILVCCSFYISILPFLRGGCLEGRHHWECSVIDATVLGA